MTHSLEPSSFSSGAPSPKVAWRWRLEDRAGNEVPGQVPTFAMKVQESPESHTMSVEYEGLTPELRNVAEALYRTLAAGK